MKFFKRKKRADRPLGVLLQIELNTFTLDQLCETEDWPHATNPSREWGLGAYRCAVLIQSSQGKALTFVSLPDGKLYGDTPFRLPLPRELKDPMAEVSLEGYGSDFAIVLDTFSSARRVMLLIPGGLLVNLLQGVPVVDYGNYKKNFSGVETEVVYDVGCDEETEAPTGKLPVVQKIASEWFSCRNSAVSVYCAGVLHRDLPLDLVRA